MSPDLDASKRKVGYLGPPSSYTHQATVDNFDPEHWELKPQGSIADVFSVVQDGSVTYGVVPFENSSNGAVVQTLDLVADRQALYPDVYILAETFVAVHHCLLGYSDGSLEDPESGEATPTRLIPSPAKSKVKPRKRVQHIRKVYSHPQAIGQCEAFLSVHLKNAERQEVSSTSKAAQIVSEDPSRTSAAISSSMAAQVHGLDILAAGIEDRPDNETRFFVLKRGEGPPHDVQPPLPTFMQEASATRDEVADKDTGGQEGTAADRQSDVGWKSLVSLTINHGETGALSRVLDLFRDSGLNLASINSRPTRGRPWHYVFFVELEGLKGDNGGGRVGEVMKRLEEVTEGCRWHGSWKKRGGV